MGSRTASAQPSPCGHTGSVCSLRTPGVGVGGRHRQLEPRWQPNRRLNLDGFLSWLYRWTLSLEHLFSNPGQKCLEPHARPHTSRGPGLGLTFVRPATPLSPSPCAPSLPWLPRTPDPGEASPSGPGN